MQTPLKSKNAFITLNKIYYTFKKLRVQYNSLKFLKAHCTQYATCTGQYSVQSQVGRKENQWLIPVVRDIDKWHILSRMGSIQSSHKSTSLFVYNLHSAFRNNKNTN